jgi:hypothetical protein
VRGCGGHPTPALCADPPPSWGGCSLLARAAGLALGPFLALGVAGILVGAGAGFGADEGFGVVGAGSSGQARG